MPNRDRSRGYSLRELRGTEEGVLLKIAGMILGGVVLSIVVLFALLYILHVLVRLDVEIEHLDIPVLEEGHSHQPRGHTNRKVWQRICLDGQNWESKREECV